MAGSRTLMVNGEARQVPLEPERSLLLVLREELGLTGAKPGCDEGVCGACTVLVDGKPTRACAVPVSQVTGEVTTIEGLAQGDALHPVQQAFLEMNAMQCGYCTPGMILATVALLHREPDPSEARIAAALEGNLCRCCIYPRIIRTVQNAAERMQQAGGSTP